MAENRNKNTAQHRLEAFREHVKELVYVFSHDMRNPLVNMKALLNEMGEVMGEIRAGKQDALDREMPEVVSMLEESVERMNRLIVGVNEIYHSMFDDIERQELPLNDLVARLVQRFEAAQNVRFTVGELPVVQADPLAMNTVFEKLLENAVEAVGEGEGEVSVTAESRDGDDLLMIRDNGRGISAEELGHIFEPFYSGSGSARGSKSGVGLCVVKGFVEAHGGEVWGESKRGEGSVFYLSLPRRGA